MGGCSDFSNHQRLAFYSVGVGLALCLVASGSPFWLEGKVDAVAVLVELLDPPRVDRLGGQASVAQLDVAIGLWWFCMDEGSQGYQCFHMKDARGHPGIIGEDGLRIEDNPTYVFFVRSLMCLCLLTSVVGLFMVCFYCCSCCKRGKTLGYGIVFFVGGILGFMAVFILTLHVDVLLGFPLAHVSYGWAFGLFLAGNSLVVLSSVVLCLLKPQEQPVSYETVVTLGTPRPPPMYELCGHVGPYKPLPPPDSVVLGKMNP